MSTKSINTKVITKINIKIWDKLKITSRKLKSIGVNQRTSNLRRKVYLLLYFLFFFIQYFLINKTVKNKDGNWYEMGSLILFCSFNHIMESILCCDHFIKKAKTKVKSIVKRHMSKIKTLVSKIISTIKTKRIYEIKIFTTK